MTQPGPVLPVRIVFDAVRDLTLENPKTIKPVTALKKKMAMDIGDDEIFLGTLKYLAQKKYIEFSPKKEEPMTVTMADSFSIHACGISAWIKWFNRPEPKPTFY